MNSTVTAAINPGTSQNGHTGQDVVLDVKGVSKRFGGLQALSDVGIHIKRGQVYGLIGPNGAGKTTFFNVLTGLYTPDSGSFELAGKPYQPTAVHEVAKAGFLGRVSGKDVGHQSAFRGREVRSDPAPSVQFEASWTLPVALACSSHLA